MATRLKRLRCCCCDEGTAGRQWWNRDTGFGICPPCANMIEAKEGAEELKLMAGIRGTHFDCQPETAGERELTSNIAGSY